MYFKHGKEAADLFLAIQTHSTVDLNRSKLHPVVANIIGVFEQLNKGMTFDVKHVENIHSSQILKEADKKKTLDASTVISEINKGGGASNE